MKYIEYSFEGSIIPRTILLKINSDIVIDYFQMKKGKVFYFSQMTNEIVEELNK